MRQTKAELKATLLRRYEAALDGLLERCEKAEDFGELEEEVTVFAEEALPVTLSELQRERKGSDFPPECPERGYKRRSKGYRQRRVLTRWGSCAAQVKRWRCVRCARTSHSHPKGVDVSGLSPAVLGVVLDLCTRLPYREAHASLRLQRLPVSVSGCERLHQAYAGLTRLGVKRQLERQSQRPFLQMGGGRSWVVQADGVFVLERDKPVPGSCEGREVKQAVMFALDEPQTRQYLALAGGAESFSPLLHGLQRQVGMRRGDKLISVADGAPWIDALFGEVGVEVRILDVYYATLYLERVMLALGWQTSRREAERASWQRGDVNARVWLRHYLPEPEVWLAWEEKDQAALRYLDARLAQTDYFDFREQGYPIGSGVIEGADKSIIGARMKRGGMRWSCESVNRRGHQEFCVPNLSSILEPKS